MLRFMISVLRDVVSDLLGRNENAGGDYRCEKGSRYYYRS